MYKENSFWWLRRQQKLTTGHYVINSSRQINFSLAMAGTVHLGECSNALPLSHGMNVSSATTPLIQGQGQVVHCSKETRRNSQLAKEVTNAEDTRRWERLSSCAYTCLRVWRSAFQQIRRHFKNSEGTYKTFKTIKWKTCRIYEETLRELIRFSRQLSG